VSKDHPAIRFDVMLGAWNPFRVAQRVTLAELEKIAATRGLRVVWATMHMIGNTTAEVTLRK